MNDYLFIVLNRSCESIRSTACNSTSSSTLKIFFLFFSPFIPVAAMWKTPSLGKKWRLRKMFSIAEIEEPACGSIHSVLARIEREYLGLKLAPISVIHKILVSFLIEWCLLDVRTDHCICDKIYQHFVFFISLACAHPRSNYASRRLSCLTSHFHYKYYVLLLIFFYCECVWICGFEMNEKWFRIFGSNMIRLWNFGWIRHSDNRLALEL